MLTKFIATKLKRANFERLEDGSYFASIPGVRGVWATGKTIVACRKELQEVFEEWLFLQISDHIKVRGLGLQKTAKTLIHA